MPSLLAGRLDKNQSLYGGGAVGNGLHSRPQALGLCVWDVLTGGSVRAMKTWSPSRHASARAAKQSTVDRRFKQQTSIASQCWRLKSELKGVGRFDFF